MIPAQQQLSNLYAAGARRVKLVCWPRENECDGCRAFRGAAVEARAAMNRALVPPPNCRTPSQCALRYLPVIDETSDPSAEELAEGDID